MLMWNTEWHDEGRNVKLLFSESRAVEVNSTKQTCRRRDVHNISAGDKSRKLGKERVFGGGAADHLVEGGTGGNHRVDAVFLLDLEVDEERFARGAGAGDGGGD